MKKTVCLFIFIFIFIFMNYSAQAKWTVVDSTTTPLKLEEGYTDGIVFDELGGYYYRGYVGSDSKYRIYNSLDCGKTWNKICEIYFGGDTVNDQPYLNAIANSFIDKCLTKNYLYMIFNTADEKLNHFAGILSYYNINDTALTKNASIMKINRATSKYEMIDTKIFDRIKGLNMIDDQYGIVLGHQSIYRTVDGCSTFQKIYSSDTIAKWYFTDCSSPTKDDYYFLFCTDKRQCKLLYTNDAGANWNFKSLPDTIYYLNSIARGKVFLINPLKYHQRLLYSEDNFDSFRAVLDTSIIRSGWAGGLYIKDDTYFITNLFDRNIFISFDKGKSWVGGDSIEIIGSQAGQIIRDGSIMNDSTVIMIDWNGTRLFIYEKNKPVAVRELPNFTNTVSIYPNPLPRSVPLNISLKETRWLTELNFKIIDINGKTIDEFSANGNRGDLHLQYLPDFNIPDGTYFLVVETDGKVIATAKFVKI